MVPDYRYFQSGPSSSLGIQCPGQSGMFDGGESNLLQSHDIIDRHDKVPVECLLVEVHDWSFGGLDALDGRELDPR
jgi:hypothetical protein